MNVGFFFFNDTATTEIYTLSLHDALPISEPGFEAGRSGFRLQALKASPAGVRLRVCVSNKCPGDADAVVWEPQDRKSTRLNSSHANISYAVFCLKKKKTHDSCTTRLTWST